MIAAATRALARVGSAAWDRSQSATTHAAISALKESGRERKNTYYLAKNRNLNVILNTIHSKLAVTATNLKNRVVQAGTHSRTLKPMFNLIIRGF